MHIDFKVIRHKRSKSFAHWTSDIRCPSLRKISDQMACALGHTQPTGVEERTASDSIGSVCPLTSQEDKDPALETVTSVLEHASDASYRSQLSQTHAFFDKVVNPIWCMREKRKAMVSQDAVTSYKQAKVPVKEIDGCRDQDQAYRLWCSYDTKRGYHCSP
jgi:hypothetical protein